MPVVFIHGVNTREDAQYDKNIATRNELLKCLVLEPLGIAELEILSPYWGGDGVSFAWNNACLPPVNILEAQGGAAQTPASDLELTVTVHDLAGTKSLLEAQGAGGSGQYKQAALADLPRFIEAVLAPVIRSEMPLAPGADPQAAGQAEAVLLLAGRDVALDADARAEVAAASSDEAVIDALKRRVQARFQERMAAQQTAPPAPTAGQPSLEAQGHAVMGPAGTAPVLEAQGHAVMSPLEAQGGGGGLLGRIGEVFDRAKDAPARAASVVALSVLRGFLNTNLTRFTGDVFVYLTQRDDPNRPDRILNDVIPALKTQQGQEPLIVLTHSMGGNVFYDILSSYLPDLNVKAWVSVASQVGLFEEMKVFKASDPAVKSPAKVPTLAPRLGYWLNLYDPADVLAFLAAPIFTDAHDEMYKTGAGTVDAHGAYFLRPSFYDVLRERLTGKI